MGTSHVIAQFAVGAEIAIALRTVVRRINQFGVVLPKMKTRKFKFKDLGSHCGILCRFFSGKNYFFDTKSKLNFCEL